MDSFNRFSEKKLPNKDDFYSILNSEHISDTQYVHAIRVWKTFKSRNMGEYHYLYLKSDVLLLSNVLENFRNTCMQTRPMLLVYKSWIILGCKNVEND